MKSTTAATTALHAYSLALQQFTTSMILQEDVLDRFVLTPQGDWLKFTDSGFIFTSPLSVA